MARFLLSVRFAPPCWLLQTPHRFRTKRQLWAYSGFAVQTYDSGEYRFCARKLQRNRERITVRGLNHNHNHDLKNLLKGAAVSAIERPGPLQDFYAALVEKGMRPSMARLTLARKISAITLTTTSPGKLNYRGLDLEKTSPLRSRQKFFLDIERFDRWSFHAKGYLTDIETNFR